MALEIVSRAGWGAKPPRAVTRRDPSELSGVAIHWFGSPKAAKTHEGCLELLRGVQRTHMAPGGLGTKGGANDIAYNHAVCPHGVAFELRGFGAQTGANGDSKSNREFAAIVYMAGTGNRLAPEAVPVLAELIRTWQAKGAGPLVKPHRFFTGSDCPGPDLLEWVAATPPPWRDGGGERRLASVEDETPPWLIDFITWRLGEGAAPKRRPKSVPSDVPESAFEAAARIDRMMNELGPQESFLDWVEWRRQGAKKAERPRSLPRKIPKPWWESLQRLEKIFRGERTMGEEDAPAPEPKQERPATDGAVAPAATLLARPRAPRKALEAYVLGRKHGGYTAAEVRAILKDYNATAKAVGLDPLLVVSQLVLETGNLSSHWSQPPRRNPAGIGVTGEPGKGISFDSWEDAVRAHVGRLLAYAVPKGEETAEQRALIDEALRVRPLPARLRGAAPTLAGLAGTWAADTKYATKLARVANEIRGAG